MSWSTTLSIFAAALGYGIGGAYMERMKAKHGKVPWWFRLTMLCVCGVVIYLGMLSLSDDSPFKVR